VLDLMSLDDPTPTQANRSTVRRSCPRGLGAWHRSPRQGPFVAAVVFFLAPQTAIDVWPWDLTPLTSRVLGSFTAQVGVGALLLSLDGRWSAWKLIVQTFFVATALLLVGAIRAWDDFHTDNLMTYLYLGGLIGSDIALLAFYRGMSQRESAARGAR
jgi:hypothetical protein